MQGVHGLVPSLQFPALAALRTLSSPERPAGFFHLYLLKCTSQLMVDESRSLLIYRYRDEPLSGLSGFSGVHEYSRCS